jgi:hypothetical protein
VSDPLGSVRALFDAASSASDDFAADGDWGVKAMFQASLSAPGVLEQVSVTAPPSRRRHHPCASSPHNHMFNTT